MAHIMVLRPLDLQQLWPEFPQAISQHYVEERSFSCCVHRQMGALTFTLLLWFWHLTHFLNRIEIFQKWHFTATHTHILRFHALRKNNDIWGTWKCHFSPPQLPKESDASNHKKDSARTRLIFCEQYIIAAFAQSMNIVIFGV